PQVSRPGEDLHRAGKHRRRGVGLRLSRREDLHPTIYYKSLKDFMEAAKGRLRGDTKWEATSEEVRHLRKENAWLKQLVADRSLANLTLKKACAGAHKAEAVRAERSGVGTDIKGSHVIGVERGRPIRENPIKTP